MEIVSLEAHLQELWSLLNLFFDYLFSGKCYMTCNDTGYQAIEFDEETHIPRQVKLKLLLFFENREIISDGQKYARNS